MLSLVRVSLVMMSLHRNRTMTKKMVNNPELRTEAKDWLRHLKWFLLRRESVLVPSSHEATNSGLKFTLNVSQHHRLRSLKTFMLPDRSSCPSSKA